MFIYRCYILFAEQKFEQSEEICRSPPAVYELKLLLISSINFLIKSMYKGKLSGDNELSNPSFTSSIFNFLICFVQLSMNFLS